MPRNHLLHLGSVRTAARAVLPIAHVARGLPVLFALVAARPSPVFAEDGTEGRKGCFTNGFM